jgi:hypothetical protein
MESESSSETLVLIYHTRRHHISKSTVICTVKLSRPQIPKFLQEREREGEREKERERRREREGEREIGRAWCRERVSVRV